jgi:hypothetical protein
MVSVHQWLLNFSDTLEIFKCLYCRIKNDSETFLNEVLLILTDDLLYRPVEKDCKSCETIFRRSVVNVAIQSVVWNHPVLGFVNLNENKLILTFCFKRFS